MRLADWREPSLDGFSGIWHGLSQRWAQRLSWDSTGMWLNIDAQRRSGLLPGLVALDGDRIAGWTFFVLHQGTLQIGGIEAESGAITRLLLDGLLAVADPSVAPSGAMLFAFSDAPLLADALDQRGFESDRYLYLVRDLPRQSGSPPDPDWERSYAVQMPALFARAYGAPSLTRPFARHGLDEEWREYVGQLVCTESCGRFEPRLSATRVSSDGVLEGAVLTTVVAPGTVHVAQVAVAPERRGQGLASAMLADVFARASADGFARVSLLVGEHNHAARTVYGKLGFVQSASFVSAGRGAAVETSAG